MSHSLELHKTLWFRYTRCRDPCIPGSVTSAHQKLPSSYIKQFFMTPVSSMSWWYMFTSDDLCTPGVRNYRRLDVKISLYILHRDPYKSDVMIPVHQMSSDTYLYTRWSDLCMPDVMIPVRQMSWSLYTKFCDTCTPDWDLHVPDVVISTWCHGLWYEMSWSLYTRCLDLFTINQMWCSRTADGHMIPVQQISIWLGKRGVGPDSTCSKKPCQNPTWTRG